MNGQIVLNINNSNVTVIGGGYRAKPQGLVGVKLAEEIALPCAVDLPIADYSVPTFKEAQAALAKTIALVKNHRSIYVGCMGGYGRTGIFIALLVKFSAMQEMERAAKRKGECVVVSGKVIEQYKTPVAWVRTHYHEHAVETNEQNNFIRDFDFGLLLGVAKFL